MKSYKTLKATLCAGIVLLAHTSGRAFIWWDDDFDDYVYQMHKPFAPTWHDESGSKQLSGSAKHESIVLPDIIFEKSKNGQHVTLTVKDLKDIKVEDIKTTYTGDNRVIVAFPYRKGKALLEVSPRSYIIAAEKEITQTNEKKDAEGTVIGSSRTSYRGQNSRGESFGFKIDLASIKNPANQPKLEGDDLVLTFDMRTAGEEIAVKAVASPKIEKEKKNEKIARENKKHAEEKPEKEVSEK